MLRAPEILANQKLSFRWLARAKTRKQIEDKIKLNFCMNANLLKVITDESQPLAQGTRSSSQTPTKRKPRIFAIQIYT